jgi:hypothetical protein
VGVAMYGLFLTFYFYGFGRRIGSREQKSEQRKANQTETYKWNDGLGKRTLERFVTNWNKGNQSNERPYGDLGYEARYHHRQKSMEATNKILKPSCPVDR